MVATQRNKGELKMTQAKQFSVLTCAVTALLSVAAQAHAAKYDLTVTNGSGMPISPAVIYIENGQQPKAQVGESPTAGFIQLCTTGHPETRASEIMNHSDVTFVTHTSAPILPGEHSTVEVELQNPARQSVHFEAMYGKTKDACSVGEIKSRDLVALSTHELDEISMHDQVLQTGAFSNPIEPNVTPTPACVLAGGGCSNACADASNAVSCLRELSMPLRGAAHIRFFAPYLPSVVDFLEAKYGASDTQSLLIPSSGAVQIQIRAE